MKTILVASSKGGVGKTTIATHLAALAALSGKRSTLVDADPQRSSTRWAERRAGLDSAVLPIDASQRGWQQRIPDDSDWVIIDAPAGAMAHDLTPYMARADAVVVPVAPSTLDVEATVPFLDTLAKTARIRRGDLRVGLVGNKLKPWTNASQQMVDLWRQWPYPLVAQLRDSQAYSVLVGLGKSMFDYHSAQVRDHQQDWQSLVDWLKKS